VDGDLAPLAAAEPKPRSSSNPNKSGPAPEGHRQHAAHPTPTSTNLHQPPPTSTKAHQDEVEERGLVDLDKLGVPLLHLVLALGRLVVDLLGSLNVVSAVLDDLMAVWWWWWWW
jgi:hypothetical protein